MSAFEATTGLPATRDILIGLVDQALTFIGEPSFSSLRALLSRAVPDDGAEPTTTGTAIAEIRRQRVAHKAVSEEIAAAIMLIQRGQFAEALDYLTEAKSFADHHGERLRVELLPPEVSVLAFEREARIARTLTGGAL